MTATFRASLNKLGLFLFLAFGASGALLASARGDGPIDQLPPAIRQFLRYEQQYMSTSVNPLRINMGSGNHQDRLYAPENGNVFEIESYWIDAKGLHAFESDGLSEPLRKMLYREKAGRRQIRFFVHPESKDLYADLIRRSERAESFHATATSSSRSLVVWKDGTPPFIAKVSLNKEVSALVRTIPISEISRSVGTDRVLAISGTLLPEEFEWMHETFGAIPTGMDRGGMLIREFPPGIIEGKRTLISLFALYGGNRANGPPLLAEMIRKSGESPTAFIRKRIIDPFGALWVKSVLDVGFSMEAHAQNTLLELGEDGLPTGRYVFRDLGGFDVDFAYREKLGLPKPANLPVISDFRKEYHQLELESAIRNSIYSHYEGGFLYNLNKDVPLWMKEGLIPTEKLGNDAFSAMLREAIRAEFSNQAGIVLPQEFGFDRLPEFVAQAREKILKSVKETKPETTKASRSIWDYLGDFRRGCARLFGFAR